MSSGEYFFMINGTPLRTSDPSELDLNALLAIIYGVNADTEVILNNYKITILKDQEEPYSFLPGLDLQICHHLSGFFYFKQSQINFYKICPNDESNPYIITAELHGNTTFSFYTFII